MEEGELGEESRKFRSFGTTFSMVSLSSLFLDTYKYIYCYMCTYIDFHNICYHTLAMSSENVY